MKVLVTGAAGFIGSAVCERLLSENRQVFGIDNLNHYYDPRIKESRLGRLGQHQSFQFQRLDVSDRVGIFSVFENFQPTHVVHLAAQAGVRYSLLNPQAYIDSNVTGFMNILEACRMYHPEHLVYASSSSVYGLNKRLPLSVEDNVDHPISIYAASKKANELMAHSYSHLFKIPTTGLRFFTVYGPWGRPDMALFLFTKNILQGTPIQVFNHGNHRRDFTFIDDIVEGVVRVTARPPVENPRFDPIHPDPASSSAPYRIYNIGGSNPVELNDMIATLERVLGRKAMRENLPIQPGDVVETYADMKNFEEDFHYRPKVGIEEGIQKFISWYMDYFVGLGNERTTEATH